MLNLDRRSVLRGAAGVIATAASASAPGNCRRPRHGAHCQRRLKQVTPVEESTMRNRTLAALAVLLMARSASAETLDEVTTKGIVMTIGTFDLDITFTPDGKFIANDGMLKGKWRVDGDKLCTMGDDG